MFVLALILLAIGAVGFIGTKKPTTENARRSRRGAKFVLVLGVLALVGASTSIVPTRNVGIVTAFNKPTGRTTGAGLKEHWPWESIDDWDASGQTYQHLGDGCVWVTIAAQRRACIPVQIEWSANADQAPEHWATYKETKVGDNTLTRFETFVARRVNPQINAAMTSVFTGFDPLIQVSADNPDTSAPDLNATYKSKLEDQLAKNLGGDIKIRSIAFEAPQYDKPTTDAINAYGQKVLEGRNLAIDEINADTRARITNKDASVNQTARCLQIAEKLGKEPGLCMTPATITRPVN